MNDCIRRAETRSLTTPHASLVAIGALIQERRILEPIRQNVQIAQKTIQHSPTDKLLDALIEILAGAQGLVEVNTILRSAWSYRPQWLGTSAQDRDRCQHAAGPTCR